MLKILPINNHPFFNSRLAKALIIILAFLFYGNTLYNGYVLDDWMVFTNNKLVTKGFSGIWEIITHDSFYGALGTYDLPGGRWRPLSLISFAIEYQFFGFTPWISHFVNVALYALTGIALMTFLNKALAFSSEGDKLKNRNHLWISFFAAILFIIHPVHTEVVANIKSRDEIFSLLFLVLCLHYCLRSVNENNRKLLWLSVSFYALALLSKENGLMLLFILPLTLYFFSKAGRSKIFYTTLPFICIVILYIIIRASLIGFKSVPITQVMDSPYLLATTEEKFATIIYIFLRYFRLLVFPHPLTYDYSYNQIPYHHFTDVSVLVSLVIYSGLLIFVFKKWQQRDVLAWCILFFLTSLFLVSNLVVNVGTPLAERFLYQPSVAYCLALILLLNRALDYYVKGNPKLKTQLIIYTTAIVTIASGYKTIGRNKDWKNESALFLHDEKISSQSARAASFAAVRYNADGDTIKDPVKQKEYRKLAIEMCYKSNRIYAFSANNYFNWGAAYARADSVERAEWAWDEASKLHLSSSFFVECDKYLADRFFNMAMNEKAKKSEDKNQELMITYLGKAMKYDTLNAEYYRQSILGH